MSKQRTTVKRTMRNPEAFVGKMIDSTKWNIPEGYERCELTGKLYREDDMTVSFPHYFFDKAFLREHRIYVEDAAWLSDEGYDIIMATLEKLGMMDFYWSQVERGDDPVAIWEAVEAFDWTPYFRQQIAA